MTAAVDDPTKRVHRFRPRGAAKRLLESRDGEVLMSGPSGTGKSTPILEKMNLCALKYPGMRGLIVRKTAVTLATTTLVTFEGHVARDTLDAGQCYWFGGSARKPAAYRYRNGSEVVVGGMDKGSKIMSSEYDLIVVDEATELILDDWERLTTRLRHGVMPYQQIIAATNPDAPQHWLNMRAREGRVLMLESRFTDNPRFYTEAGERTKDGDDYLAVLDNLTGVRKARLKDGLWVAAEGVIWDGWDAAVHLVDRFEVPADWPRYWSIDFGYVHPFVCQRWARDPDGRFVLYAETYCTGRLVEDHAADLLAVLAAGEPAPVYIVCDHDAEGRATLERHLRRSTRAAPKQTVSVTEGLEAVASRLKIAGDGKPRLTIMRDTVARVDQTLADARKPTCTAHEIPAYVWANGKLKEEPLKESDDGCDAMRYFIAEADLGVTPRIRMVGGDSNPHRKPAEVIQRADPSSSQRVVIVGGPRRGKSTVAAGYLERGVPVFCGDPESKVKEPMAGVTYLPEGIDFAGDDGAAAWVSANWFTKPGPWVCEGHAMARALKRWMGQRPDKFPCDRVIVLDDARASTSPGQEAMHKGVMTVWAEIRGRYAPIVGPAPADGLPRFRAVGA